MLCYMLHVTCLLLFFGNMTCGDRYSLKILVVACKKAATRKWCKADPPVRDDWRKTLAETCYGESESKKQGLKTSRLEKNERDLQTAHASSVHVPVWRVQCLFLHTNISIAAFFSKDLKPPLTLCRGALAALVGAAAQRAQVAVLQRAVAVVAARATGRHQLEQVLLRHEAARKRPAT